MENRRNTASLQEKRKLRMMYLALKTDLMNIFPITAGTSHHETCAICHRIIDSLVAKRQADKVRLPGDNNFPADKMNNAASGQPIRGQDKSSLTLQEKVIRRLKHFASKWKPSPSKPDCKCIENIPFPKIMLEYDNALWKGIEKKMKRKRKSLQEIRKERLKYFQFKGKLTFWSSKSGLVVSSSTVRRRDSIGQRNGDGSSVKSSIQSIVTSTTDRTKDPISQSNGGRSMLFNALTAQIIKKHDSAPLPTANQESSSTITTDEANQRKQLAEMWHSDILPVQIIEDHDSGPSKSNQDSGSVFSPILPITIDETSQRNELTKKGLFNILTKTSCVKLAGSLASKDIQTDAPALVNVKSFLAKNDHVLSTEMIETPDIGPSETKQVASTSRLSAANSDETIEPNKLAREGRSGILDKITTKNSCDSVGKKSE